MKKTTRKLQVRGETLRVLRALDNLDLVRATGGGTDTAIADSTDTQSGFNCPNRAAAAVGTK
jgi:hypothetical protein